MSCGILSDKNFNAASTQGLQHQLQTLLKRNEKIENLSHDIEIIEKNQMDIIELKNATENFKSSLGGSIMQMIEDKSGEFEERSIKFSQSEQQREEALKNK